MAQPVMRVEAVGRERHMLVVLDDFVADPHALRRAAAAASFGPARVHYPGIRAELPPSYLAEVAPVLRRALAGVFGRHGAPETIDASFSIVTTPPDRLSDKQRLPHCDAFDAHRFALLHFLGERDQGGTAFFRHRTTGFEAIDQARAPAYFAAIEREVRAEGAPHGYVDDDTPLFERIALGEHRFNRALLYPSFLLHSGAIPHGARLSADPLEGRLTVTGFFSAPVR